MKTQSTSDNALPSTQFGIVFNALASTLGPINARLAIGLVIYGLVVPHPKVGAPVGSAVWIYGGFGSGKTTAGEMLAKLARDSQMLDTSKNTAATIKRLLDSGKSLFLEHWSRQAPAYHTRESILRKAIEKAFAPIIVVSETPPVEPGTRDRVLLLNCQINPYLRSRLPYSPLLQLEVTTLGADIKTDAEELVGAIRSQGQPSFKNRIEARDHMAHVGWIAAASLYARNLL